MKKRIIWAFSIFLMLSAAVNPCYAIKIGLETDAEHIGIGASVETSLIDANTNKTVQSLKL